MDVDSIMAKQLKQMEKELREKETKLRTQEKKASLSQLYPTLGSHLQHSNICIYFDASFFGLQQMQRDALFLVTFNTSEPRYLIFRDSRLGAFILVEKQCVFW
jgi:hypothetical protein